MSALISSATVAAAQRVANGSSGETTNATSGDAAGLGQFAALFATLMKGQPGELQDFGHLLASPQTDAVAEADTDAATASGDLNAVLPFLEAMGFTHSSQPLGEGKKSPFAETNIDDSAIPLAIAATPAQPADPAISAVAADNGAGKQAAMRTSLDTRPIAVENSAGKQAAVPTSPEMQPAIETTQNEPVAVATPDAAAKDLARGREFSSQLVEAIAASKEEVHSPGNVAAAVHQVIAEASPRHTQTAAAAQAVAQPVGSAAWSEEVGSKIVWMANRNESKADLVLTPPQMGRVEVNLSISGDQATANFVSGNAAVREALEAALPRLREVLADAGIQLGQAQVGAENARQSAQQEKNGDNFAFDRGFPSDNGSSHARSGGLSVVNGLKTGRGLVDIFA